MINSNNVLGLSVNSNNVLGLNSLNEYLVEVALSVFIFYYTSFRFDFDSMARRGNK